MLVLPDTNVLFSDPFLEGAQVRTILAAENYTDLQLVIPQLVVDELRNHVEKRLKAIIDDVDKVRRDYAKLSGFHPYYLTSMIDAGKKQAVLDRFEKRIQQLETEGRILCYPSMSPKELAYRSIKVKAPFQENDKGMRDTLIWLTAKEQVLQGKPIDTTIIVVAKDKAFWDKDKKKLNEGLVEELKDSGIPLDSIAISNDFQEIIKTHIYGKLPQIKWVEVAIKGGKVIDFTDASDAVPLEVTDWILKNPEIVDVGGYIFVEFDVVEEVFLESIDAAFDLGSNEALVNSKWTCYVAALGFENYHFGNSLLVTLELELSSVIKINEDRLSVKSHEVIDMDVMNYRET